MIVKLILKRLGISVVFLLVLSVVSFILIRLPPGDFVTSLIASREMAGGRVDPAEIEAMKVRYGTNAPPAGQYFIWLGRFIRGDFGLSYSYNKPVKELLADRLPLTIILTLFSVLVSYLIAIPAGTFSAIKQHTIFDYSITLVTFIGIATPGFLLALFVMFFFVKTFSISLLGIQSKEFLDAPWSFSKFLDILKHLPLPILIAGFGGAASTTRIMRGSMLDEINKQYVTTGRAKGLREAALIKKYPLRVALNPILSSVGWILPTIISGDVILGVVLGLPTIGPLLLDSLKNQDIYLAQSLLMIMGIMVVTGTFVSDMLLIWTDPRIRME
jgi:peptide/nickel transport system permease protein